MIDEGRIDEIAALLDARFGLCALWIFGSEARGEATTQSDVDLAALFRETPEPLALIEARVAIEELLGRDVDLLDLDQASPILAMQVIRNGTLLREPERRRRVDFVAHLPGRYEDVQRVREPIVRALLARVSHG